jgi:heparan-alpha-glucosaminide N-acetyltransferase
MRTTDQAATSAGKPGRLMSLDAYRGFIMLTLASAGFGIAKVAEKMNSSFWHALVPHVRHPEWISNTGGIGFAYWDLIQPSFMFMVGVAMPYSYARRVRDGHSMARMTGHAVTRAVVLTLLGVFLASNWSTQTDFVFFNVLSQIGLGYLFVFWLMWCPFRVQLLAIVAILVGYWALFFVYPAPGADFDYAASGIDRSWVAPGLFAHWTKNANAAWRVDVWLLNLFPRSEPFRSNPGGYTTLNFVPSIVTMLLGVMAGQLLRGPRSSREKLARLLLGGIACMLVGVAAGYTVCPIVKRIWTPSWALFSGAWTLWLLATFYYVIDVRERRASAFPLAVVGMNSILMYMMFQLIRGWTAETLQIHFGQEIFAGTYGPILESLSVLAVFWLICWWLYRQKIFIRI